MTVTKRCNYIYIFDATRINNLIAMSCALNYCSLNFQWSIFADLCASLSFKSTHTLSYKYTHVYYMQTIIQQNTIYHTNKSSFKKHTPKDTQKYINTCKHTGTYKNIYKHTNTKYINIFKQVQTQVYTRADHFTFDEFREFFYFRRLALAQTKCDFNHYKKAR